MNWIGYAYPSEPYGRQWSYPDPELNSRQESELPVATANRVEEIEPIRRESTQVSSSLMWLR